MTRSDGQKVDEKNWSAHLLFLFLLNEWALLLRAQVKNLSFYIIETYLASFYLLNTRFAIIENTCDLGSETSNTKLKTRDFICVTNWNLVVLWEVTCICGKTSKKFKLQVTLRNPASSRRRYIVENKSISFKDRGVCEPFVGLHGVLV